jgi:hypothetical protein
MRPSGYVPALLLVAACSNGAAPRAAVECDVDGDGHADRAAVVESGPREAPDWRFGVRVTMSTLGEQTAWQDEGAGFNDGQELLGITDVNGDGHGEVVVQVGTSASERYVGIAEVVGDRLVWTTPAVAREVGTLPCAPPPE